MERKIVDEKFITIQYSYCDTVLYLLTHVELQVEVEAAVSDTLPLDLSC